MSTSDQKHDIIERLSNAELFSELNPEQLDRLCAVGKLSSFGRNDVIFREGEPGNSLYVICSGAIRVSRTMPGMGEEAFAILRPGSLFGEMSVFDDSPRSADAICHEASELFVIEKEDFKRLLTHNRLMAAKVLWKLVRLLSQRLRETNDKMAFLSVCGRFE